MHLSFLSRIYHVCDCVAAEEGVVSRDGWVIIDDSLRPRMDLNAEGSGIPWPRAPPAAALRGDGSYSDAYVFAHGRNYTAAVRDFKDLSGPIPLSPRHALGPAFSRWFQWNDVEVSGAAAHVCARAGLPALMREAAQQRASGVGAECLAAISSPLPAGLMFASFSSAEHRHCPGWLRRPRHPAVAAGR